MGYNLLINGVYWGYNLVTNLLLTSWDILVEDQLPPCRFIAWFFSTFTIFHGNLRGPPVPTPPQQEIKAIIRPN